MNLSQTVRGNNRNTNTTKVTNSDEFNKQIFHAVFCLISEIVLGQNTMFFCENRTTTYLTTISSKSFYIIFVDIFLRNH